MKGLKKYYTIFILAIIMSLSAAFAGTMQDVGGVLQFESKNIFFADGSIPLTGDVDFGNNDLSNVDSINGIADTELNYLDGVSSNIQTQINDVNSDIQSINVTSNVSTIESNYIKKDGTVEFTDTINTSTIYVHNFIDNIYSSIRTTKEIGIGTLFDFDPIGNSTDTSKIRFFRNVNTNGEKLFQIMKGDGTFNPTFEVNATNGIIFNFGGIDDNLNMFQNNITNFSNIGVVSETELNYLTGVTSNIQTQINDANSDIQSINVTSNVSTIESNYIKKDGSVAFVGDIDVNGNNIINSTNYINNMYYDFYPVPNNLSVNPCQNRPFINNVYKTISVSNSTEFQEALCQIPIINHGRIIIQLENGTYNDTFIVPAPAISQYTSLTEGQSESIIITGNSYTPYVSDGSDNINNNVKVNSLLILGGNGNQHIGVWNMNIFGTEKYSDEEPSISVYGGAGSMIFRKINFTATTQYAIMGYGTGELHVQSNNFGGSYDYAVLFKRSGWCEFGDAYNNAYNTGSINEALFFGSGLFYSKDEANRVQSPKIAECHGHSFNYEGSSIRAIFNNIDVCDIDKESNEVEYSNLVAYYPLNKNINNHVLEYFGHDGEINNIVFNKTYANFNGIDGYIDTNYDIPLETFGDHGFSFWIKTNGLTANKRIFTQDYGRFGCEIYSSTELRCFSRSSADATIPREFDFIDYDNEWTHVAFFKYGDLNKSIVYINGKEVASSTAVANTYYNLSGRLVIGAKDTYSSQSDFFNGSLADLMIWNTSFTSNQVYKLYIDGLNDLNQINQTIESPKNKESITPLNREIGGTIYGNINILENNKFCLNGETCSAYIYYNGSCIVGNVGSGESCLLS